MKVNNFGPNCKQLRDKNNNNNNNPEMFAVMIYSFKELSSQPRRTSSARPVLPKQLKTMFGHGMTFMCFQDWDQHVKGKLHLQNRALYATDR